MRRDFEISLLGSLQVSREEGAVVVLATDIFLILLYCLRISLSKIFDALIPNFPRRKSLRFMIPTIGKEELKGMPQKNFSSPEVISLQYLNLRVATLCLNTSDWLKANQKLAKF